MFDIQNQPDHRKIEIQKVGIKNIRYPIKVLDKTRGTQSTVASVNMYVSLPHQFKGTHMSRFVEVLSAHRNRMNLKNFETILEALRDKLLAQSAHLQVSFPYFIEKMAPVSGVSGLMEYTCQFSGSVGEVKDFHVGVKVPVATVCPCSKEISDRGSHNQRGVISVRVWFHKFFWIEDLVEVIEGSASCDLYPILKRPDEKFVTEKAYDNPTFVEDVVRNVSIRLNSDANILGYSVEAENLESIHNHSAYAYVEKLPEWLERNGRSWEFFAYTTEAIT